MKRNGLFKRALALALCALIAGAGLTAAAGITPRAALADGYTDQMALAETMLKAGNDELAMMCFDAAASLRPDAAEPLIAKGRALLSLGKVSQALALAKQAAALEADSEAARAFLLEATAALGLPADAGASAAPPDVGGEGFEAAAARGALRLADKSVPNLPVGATIFSVSPDGKRLIGADGTGVFLLNAETGARTAVWFDAANSRVEGDLGQKQIDFLLLSPPAKYLRGIGSLVWSPDGKTVAWTCWSAAMQQMLNIGGVFVADAETGAFRCLKQYPGKLMKDGGYVYSACFSADSRTLYYGLYSSLYKEAYSSYAMLMACDLASGECRPLTGFGVSDKLLCSLPDIARLPDGALASVFVGSNANSDYGLLVTTVADARFRGSEATRPSDSEGFAGRTRDAAVGGGAVADAEKRAVRASTYKILGPRYLSVAQDGTTLVQWRLVVDGSGALFVSVASASEDFTGWDMPLRIESAESEQAERVSLDAFQPPAGWNAAEKLALFPELSRAQAAALSPDGGWALLLLNNVKEGSHALRLLNTRTLRLSPVALPDDLPAEKLLGVNSRSLEAGIVWGADNTVLLAALDGSVRVMRFEIAP